MSIKILERPYGCVDITAGQVKETNPMWVTINTARITELQIFLSKEVEPDLGITGLFDRPTFKALVFFINKRGTMLSNVWAEYPEKTIEDTLFYSAGYLQRFLGHCMNVTVVIDGKIGSETVNALNGIFACSVLSNLPEELERRLRDGEWL